MASDAGVVGSSPGSAVLVHGGWGNPEDWHWVRRRLEGAGVQVHAPDLPSHRSPSAGLTDDAEEVRRVLRSAAAPVVLAGWSYGGDVVGVASAGEVPVAHLVYVSCCPRAEGSPGPGTGWLEEHPRIAITDHGTHLLDDEWWLQEEAGTTFPEDVRRHLRRHPRREASLRTETDAHVGRAGWEDVPTTVVLGREDPLLLAEERAQASARCTDVRWVDGDHFLIWRRPDLIASVVLEALRAPG